MRNSKPSRFDSAPSFDETDHDLEHDTPSLIPMVGVTLLILDVAAVIVTLLMSQ
jgi:hypothetical protein